VDSEQVQERMDRFDAAFEGAGLKKTPQRVLIFREVARTTEHPDAETIWKAVRGSLPNLSLDTVYRTLWLFIDIGLIATLGPPRERARFDANLDPHHHFVCTSCGAARDVPAETVHRLNVPAAVREWGRVDVASVEFRGLCSRCLAMKAETIGTDSLSETEVV
jgi:Fur family transcriptional regulator, peroxide stress response regulator